MKLDVEALARVLATNDVHELVMSDRWLGWPDYENEEEMAEAVELRLAGAREHAERYVKILLGRGE